MKQATDYPTNTAIALLLAGDSGCGKTTNLFYWPRPWILDLEGNFKGAIEWHTQCLGKLPNFQWDTPALSATGQPLPLQEQFKRCRELVDAAVADPSITTICIDGLGRFYDLLKQELSWLPGEKPVIIAGQRTMGLAQWGVYPDLLKRFIWDLRAKGKPLIVTAHLKITENVLSTVDEYRIADLQTDFGKSNSFPKCFSDYYQTLSEPVAKDAAHPRGVRYKLRTAPNIRNPSLKTSFAGMPDEFEASESDPAFKALLAKVAGGVPLVAAGGSGAK